MQNKIDYSDNKVLLVLNKTDLDSNLKLEGTLNISAKTDQGVDNLLDKLFNLLER